MNYHSPPLQPELWFRVSGKGAPEARSRSCGRVDLWVMRLSAVVLCDALSLVSAVQLNYE